MKLLKVKGWLRPKKFVFDEADVNVDRSIQEIGSGQRLDNLIKRFGSNLRIRPNGHRISKVFAYLHDFIYNSAKYDYTFKAHAKKEINKEEVFRALAQVCDLTGGYITKEGDILFSTDEMTEFVISNEHIFGYIYHKGRVKKVHFYSGRDHGMEYEFENIKEPIAKSGEKYTLIRLNRLGHYDEE